MKDITKKFILTLFDEGENINYGSKYECDTILINEFTFIGQSYSHWSEKNKCYTSKPVQFFSINPLQEGSRRNDKFVVAYRNLLFESDSLSLDDQKRFFVYANKNHGFPFSTLTYTGNDGYHCIPSLAVPLTSKEEYKKVFKRIMFRLNEIAEEMCDLPDGDKFKITHPGKPFFDSSVSNPSRCSRFPNVVRLDTGKLQNILVLLPRVTQKDFQAFLDTCPPPPPSRPKAVKVEDPVWDIAVGNINEVNTGEFLTMCSYTLRSKIDYLIKNPDVMNRNRRLLSIYCGLIEEFPTLTKEFILDLCEEKLYPALKGAGYPDSKIYNNTLYWCLDNAKENEEEENVEDMI